MTVRYLGPPPDNSNVPKKNRRTKHAVMAEDLKAHPGQWGVVSVHNTSSSALVAASQMRTGKKGSYQPREEWEVKYAFVDDEHRVYVRYIGKPED